MKRLAAALALAISALFFGQSVAATAPYGPDGPAATTSTPTVAPGGEFTITVRPCEIGSLWTFEFQDQTKTDTCRAAVSGFRAAQATGVASATFTAPSTGGTFTGTATSGTTTVTFSISIQGAAQSPAQGAGGSGESSAAIPATGSDSTRPAIAIAALLLAVGAGLVAVAYVRTRRPATTT